MPQFLSDSFTGTPGTALEVYNPSWVISTGATGPNLCIITSDGSRVRSSGTAAYFRSDAPAPSADYWVSADLYASSLAGYAGPCIRVSNTAHTLYQLRYLHGTGFQIVRYLNGSSTTLATSPYTMVAGETVNLKLKATGSLLEAYINGSDTALLSVTNTSITEPGHAGIRFQNTGSGQLQIDNLLASTPDGGVIVLSATVTPSGGIALSGNVPSTMSATRTSSGGVVTGGNANVSQGLGALQRIVIPVGGLVMNGVASTIRGVYRASTGGLSLSGQATISRVTEGAMALVGALGDVISQHFLILGSFGTLNDKLRENSYWRALAGADGILSLNDVKKKVLKGEGYEGSLNDMEKKWWSE